MNAMLTELNKQNLVFMSESGTLTDSTVLPSCASDQAFRTSPKATSSATAVDMSSDVFPSIR
ncbi:hypothetical protein Hypma_002767 [Hypsizygus marmoreus]|uniref:Uncharacterized protein n=1 Tax=Hypsizygus marmoreus TaxID=39966 RepID=A0A369J3D8_HYPMA|nr:hypothetical protein Hypma_002767 [Hypsizygus marmoreus]